MFFVKMPLTHKDKDGNQLYIAVNVDQVLTLTPSKSDPNETGIQSAAGGLPVRVAVSLDAILHAIQQGANNQLMAQVQAQAQMEAQKQSVLADARRIKIDTGKLHA